MKKKTRILIMMLCGILFISSIVSAGETATLEQIIAAVKENEAQLNDCKIEYTTIERPYNANNRELTEKG